MNDALGELRVELQMRLQEVESLTLEVSHLRADLQVKDEYIRVLQVDLPSTPAELIAARRYLAARSRIRTELLRHPLAWRGAWAVVSGVRRWRQRRS